MSEWVKVSSIFFGTTPKLTYHRKWD